MPTHPDSLQTNDNHLGGGGEGASSDGEISTSPSSPKSDLRSPISELHHTSSHRLLVIILLAFGFFVALAATALITYSLTKPGPTPSPTSPPSDPIPALEQTISPEADPNYLQDNLYLSLDLPSQMEIYEISNRPVEWAKNYEVIAYICYPPVNIDRTSSFANQCPNGGIQIWMNGDGWGGGCDPQNKATIAINHQNQEYCLFDEEFRLMYLESNQDRYNIQGSLSETFSMKDVAQILSTFKFTEPSLTPDPKNLPASLTNLPSLPPLYSWAEPEATTSLALVAGYDQIDLPGQKYSLTQPSSYTNSVEAIDYLNEYYGHQIDPEVWKTEHRVEGVRLYPPYADSPAGSTEAIIGYADGFVRVIVIDAYKTCPTEDNCATEIDLFISDIIPLSSIL